jgi:hypothetical protein
MKTWVLAITLFGLDGHEPWRHVKVPGLSEIECADLLARTASANPKGRGMAVCYDGSKGPGLTGAMPSAEFVGQ